MLTQESVIKLIRNSSNDDFGARRIPANNLDYLAGEICESVEKAEEENREITELKLRVKILEAENEVYRTFLTGSGYVIPKEKANKK